MSSTAPAMIPPTATRANGTRNQVGSSVVSAPIGSAASFCANCWSEPASNRPQTMRMIGARVPPNVVHPTTPRPEALRGR